MPKFKTSPNYVMNMGFNSKDSDTTFKEKDQANIKAGPGKYSKYPLDNAIISGAVKVFKGFGKIRGSGSSAPAPKSTTSAPATTNKKADFGATKQSFLSNVGPVKPKAKKEPVSTSAPKPRAKVKAVSTISPSKPASVSAPVSKPKATAITSAPKPKADASAPKTKSSKIRAKGEAALASGNVKKAQRLRKRYDRVAKKENKRAAKSGGSIADAYKVNL